MPEALFLEVVDGHVVPSVRMLEAADLPDGDVLVSVSYSSLNYKDGLAVTGRGKIIRGKYPFIPGIDFAGRVVDSTTDRYRAGDAVIGTGWGFGETAWGGFTQLQRARSAQLVPLPDGMSLEQAMVAGTAGLTAMLAIVALEAHGAAAGSGEVLVTGASGGLGSIAVSLLAASGFDVVASTGSAESHDYLRRLGARRVIHRDELARGPQRPLDTARWAGAVDAVGGQTLATVLSGLARHASVAACGNTGGHELNTTVYPFILRGVNLLGIDSNTCPVDQRSVAWKRLADTLTDDVYELLKTAVIGLDEIPSFSERILAGHVRGRVVVDVHQR